MYHKPGRRGGGGGGRTSDKFVTESSGFLDKLLPGDMVMADRGFTISESVGLKQAKLKIPAFTKGKSQLVNSRGQYLATELYFIRYAIQHGRLQQRALNDHTEDR